MIDDLCILLDPEDFMWDCIDEMEHQRELYDSTVHKGDTYKYTTVGVINGINLIYQKLFGKYEEKSKHISGIAVKHCNEILGIGDD